ncbi:MAG: hypothetical protein P1U89_01585 [Verrucomicrobiales bacterium]|nr:hypothetical protein [Verrucomicrobiales bacterium]
MRISSSLVDVRPEQIELLLDTKEAPTHLIVDDKGYFEVPNTKKLHEEDPLLIANQPRGTLNISFKMEVGGYVPPKIENGQISYKKLFEGVLDLQREVREVDPTFGLMGKGQFALRITTDKPIKINREMGVGDRKIKGSRTFRPINGIIYLFMEAYMFDDNPVVEIPGDVTIEIKQFPSHVAEKIKADY